MLTKQFNVKEKAILQDVPSIKQKGSTCGPVVAYQILRYYKKGADYEDLCKKLIRPHHRNTLNLDLVVLLEQRGIVCDVKSGTLSEIKQAIKNKIPPIVCFDTANLITINPLKRLKKGDSLSLWLIGDVPLKEAFFRKQPHYAVLSGFDDARAELYMSNLKGELTEMSYSEFLTRWKKRSCFLILPVLKKDKGNIEENTHIL